jgi:hypothetical protein
VKKIIIAISFLFVMGTSSFSLEPGLTLGVSGNAGLLNVKGSEFLKNGAGDASGDVIRESSRTEDIPIAYGTIFAEFYLDERFRVGASFMIGELESETTERVDGSFTNCPEPNLANACNDSDSLTSGSNGQQNGTGTAEGNVTNKVQVDLRNLATVYASYHHESGGFITAGVLQGDLTTNEVLGTGSQYGNAKLNGYTYGIGYERGFNFNDSELFIRAELNQTHFEKISLTATGSDNRNSIQVDQMDGTNGVISIGKNF